MGCGVCSLWQNQCEVRKLSEGGVARWIWGRFGYVSLASLSLSIAAA